MKIFHYYVFITITLLMSIQNIFALSDNQKSIIESLKEDAPSSLIASKVDKLIKESPTCNTVDFLCELIEKHSIDKLLLFRISRKINKIGCKKNIEILKKRLVEIGNELSVGEDINNLFQEASTDNKIEIEIPKYELQIQKGFSPMECMRLASSPSTRYLSVGGFSGKGYLSVWDRIMKCRINTFNKMFALLSIFYDENYLFAVSPISIHLWNFIKNTSRTVLFNIAFPTFIDLSPNKKKLLINDKEGNLYLYNLVVFDNDVSTLSLEFIQKISGHNIQIAKFIDNEKILLGSFDGNLMIFNLKQNNIVSSIFIGDYSDLTINQKGDITYEFLKIANHGFNGIRDISISYDSNNYAVLANKKIFVIKKTLKTNYY